MLRRLLRRAKGTLISISPRLGVQLLYWLYLGRWFSWRNPKRYTEKIQVLKVTEYDRNPIYTRCADKYQVREYLREKGLEHLLVPLLGVFENADEIDFEALPNAFALKWNFGNGHNIICPDKGLLDLDKARSDLTRWGKQKAHLLTGEMQYKRIPKKIVCEKLITPKAGLKTLVDAKTHCFDGKAYGGYFIFNRNQKDLPKFCGYGADFAPKVIDYDVNGFDVIEELPFPIGEEVKASIISLSERLSADFRHARVDLMFDGEQLYFSELTFTSGGGYDLLVPEVDYEMGALLRVD